MTPALASVASVISNSTRRRFAWKELLLSAFLAFGLAVPYASATCLSKTTMAHNGEPALPAVIAPAELADGLRYRAQLDSRFPDSIVGLWHVTFSSGGQVVDVAYDAFHEDGNEILNDYTDPIEGNVCLGTWEQTGLRTYMLKHPSWSFDSTGKLTGTVIITESLTLDDDGNSYSGKYKYDIYDIQGKLQQEFTGKIKASRITP